MTARKGMRVGTRTRIRGLREAGPFILTSCEASSVAPEGVASVTIDPANATLDPDSTIQLTATVLGSGGVPLTKRSRGAAAIRPLPPLAWPVS